MAKYFDDTVFPEASFEKMTPEMLRCYPGCEHYNDEQANEIIDSLER
jgi:hypothetical protein